MKSKHIAAIALSAMMVFGLAGCGGADSSTAEFQLTHSRGVRL